MGDYINEEIVLRDATASFLWQAVLLCLIVHFFKDVFYIF